MTVFLVPIAIGVVLLAGERMAMYRCRAARRRVARANIRAEQRRAEADLQHLLQTTVQRMFDAARRLQ